MEGILAWLLVVEEGGRQTEGGVCGFIIMGMLLIKTKLSFPTELMNDLARAAGKTGETQSRYVLCTD